MSSKHHPRGKVTSFDILLSAAEQMADQKSELASLKAERNILAGRCRLVKAGAQDALSALNVGDTAACRDILERILHTLDE